MPERPSVGAVVIGRNEGERLRTALASVRPQVARLVYVDSGSTDGSVDLARGLGADVICLDLSTPFTAARARNAGLDRLLGRDAPDFVQFLDGDCALDPGWIPEGLAFLATTPACAVVSGRLRERFPDASVYNRLCDAEWDAPPGAARACGGIALFRIAALREERFDAGLIAGEEPELCFRLRRRGWTVWRLPHEMALHDAAMTRFGQWWTRRRRGGFAFAQGYAMHGSSPERYCRRETLRILVWALALPLAILLAALALGPLALLLVLLYPAQILRIAARSGLRDRWSWIHAGFLVLGVFAELGGVATYALRRLRRGPARLIEYK